MFHHGPRHSAPSTPTLRSCAQGERIRHDPDRADGGDRHRRHAVRRRGDEHRRDHRGARPRRRRASWRGVSARSTTPPRSPGRPAGWCSSSRATRTRTATRYWAECAKGNVTTQRDRDAALQRGDRASAERGPEAARPRELAGRRSLEDLMAQEKNRVEQAAKFSNFTVAEIAAARRLQGVQVSVWTAHQHERAADRARLPLLLPPGLHRAGPGLRAPGRQRLDPHRRRRSPGRPRRRGKELEVPTLMKRRAPGFTLLEVVVALAILGAGADGHLRPQLRARSPSTPTPSSSPWRRCSPARR